MRGQNKRHPLPAEAEQTCLSLWTTDEASGPETAATSRLDISKAIFQILIRHLTTVAKSAGRKIEILEAFSQFSVAGLIPDLE